LFPCRFTAGIVVSNINGFSQNENGNNYLSDFGLKPNIQEILYPAIEWQGNSAKI
jgi:hypothetical protein